jgi:hypothetical protein
VALELDSKVETPDGLPLGHDFCRFFVTPLSPFTSCPGGFRLVGYNFATPRLLFLHHFYIALHLLHTYLLWYKYKYYPILLACLPTQLILGNLPGQG